MFGTLADSSKKVRVPGYTVNLMYYIGSMIAISAIWANSSKNIVTLHPKWIFVIVGMGLLSGYCMHLYTTTVLDPKVQAGIFMVMSALMYAFFSLVFDWQIIAQNFHSGKGLAHCSPSLPCTV